MAIHTLFPPTTQRPQSQFSVTANVNSKRPGAKRTGLGPFTGADIAILKDNFSLSTWLLLGGLFQVLLSFIFPRSYLAFPVVAILGWRIVDAFLMHFGVKQNPLMEGVILGKTSIAYPSEGDTQTVRGRPGDNGPGAVMLLGAKSNSALGMFGHGYKEVSDYMSKMLEQLEDNAEETGFMGMTNWLGNGERSTGNELTTISYWRSIEDIHAFALSDVHREAWNWWNDNLSKHKNVGIMHEIFALPKEQGWEGIYANYAPTGLGRTTKAVHVGGSDEKGGEKVWVNPLIDASRGVYRSSRGRMSRGDPEGKGQEGIVNNPYVPVSV